MSNLVWRKADSATSAAVSQAVRNFATALAETPQFQAFEQAYDAFRSDAVARQAVEAHQTKLRSLRMLRMLNAVNDEDRAELEYLHQVVLDQPTVAAYTQAEEALIALLRAAADAVSEQIGLPFAVSRSGCCG